MSTLPEYSVALCLILWHLKHLRTNISLPLFFINIFWVIFRSSCLIFSWTNLENPLSSIFPPSSFLWRSCSSYMWIIRGLYKWTIFLQNFKICWYVLFNVPSVFTMVISIVPQNQSHMITVLLHVYLESFVQKQVNFDSALHTTLLLSSIVQCWYHKSSLWA